MAQVEVTAREWRWVAAASVLVMALTLIPYAIGWITSTPEVQYGGFLFGLEDMHSYLAKMRYGARAGWFFQIVYTSEPHQGAVVYTFHLALGKLAATLTGRPLSMTSLMVAYHAARIVLGLLMLSVTYRFIAAFLTDVRQRRLAWVLSSIGGGLGWLVLLLFGPNWLGILPNEFYIPEGYSFLTLLIQPHLALVRALLLLGWLSLLRAVEHASPRWAVLASLCWFVMGMIVPIYVGLIGVLVAAWFVALWVRSQKFPRQAFQLAALSGILPIVIFIYNAWVFTSDPIFRTWSAQNYLPSPHPLHYVAAYGLLAILAAWGVGPMWRADERRGALLVSWVVAAPILIYLPINVQRRLAEGVIVPLSILAVVGLNRITSNWRSRRRRLANVATLVLLLPSSVVMLIGGSMSMTSDRWPLFHPADELAALAWLQDHAPPDAIILATFRQANVIPAYADVRVYAGHGPETVESDRKRVEVAQFFGPTMTDTQRQALIDEGRVDYIFFGPQESAACPDSACLIPSELDLERVYSHGDYTIYATDS